MAYSYTEEDLIFLKYSAMILNFFNFPMFIFLLISYIVFKNHNIRINNKSFITLLLIVSLISVRMLLETITHYNNQKCELYEFNCKYCPSGFTANFIFAIYSLVSLYFYFLLLNISNKVTVLHINYSNTFLILSLIPTIISTVPLLILIYNQIYKYEYLTVKLIIWEDFDICAFNPDMLNDYIHTAKYLSPYLFSTILFYLFSYVNIFHRLIRIFNLNLDVDAVMKSKNLIFKNINITFSYILVYFSFIIVPLYIFEFLPVSSYEYLFTIMVLSLYFQEIKLFHKIYNFVYYYPIKLLNRFI